MPKIARRTLTASAAVIGIVVIAGCASTPSNDAPESAEDFAAVTIEHALGEAVITEKPERIVTLGQGSAETVLAMGVAPVGIQSYPWGSDDTGYLPWIYEEVERQGMELPQQFVGDGQEGTELNVEDVAALKPDLILAPWSGVTWEQYDMLTDIAPTVAYEEQPWVITWEEQIEVIGTAMGESEKAQDLIDQVNDELSSSAVDAYDGITFSYIYTSGPDTLGVFFEDEQRVAMIRALGLTVDPVVNELKEFEVPGTDSALMSLENVDKLANSDLIFTFYATPEARAETESQGAYQQIPAVARGSVVAPTDTSLVTASSLINPLTVPWVTERYVPLIDEAIAKLDR